MRFTVLALCAITAPAHAASPRDELKAVVASVAADPGNRALREKAIALAGKLKPAPVVPPEAKRPFVMAATFQKEAKSPSDFGLAVDAYREALVVAPWWSDAYYNLSVSLEAAGRFDEARDALSLYLLAKPKDEAAQNRLYALEAKKKLAAKQAAAAAAKTWFCAWFRDERGTFITVDASKRTVTYVERHEGGHEKPAIVTPLDVVDTVLRWGQNETFSNGYSTRVSYVFGTVSGGLDYTYTGSAGDARNNHLDCVPVAPRR